MQNNIILLRSIHEKLLRNRAPIPLPESVTIVENSFFARMATWYMGSKRVAMVWDKQILLWGVTRHDFLKHRGWVLHELKHVEQYAQLGKWNFLKAYLAEWVVKGYYNNRFEVEAREAETRA